MAADALNQSRLCYLDAAYVDGLSSTGDDVDVWNEDDGKIGRLDGIVLDPERRHVEYLVVAGGWLQRHRYLLPFEPARVDIGRHALCVDTRKTDLARCEEFESRAFPRLSNDDLLVAPG